MQASGYYHYAIIHQGNDCEVHKPVKQLLPHIYVSQLTKSSLSLFQWKCPPVLGWALAPRGPHSLQKWG